MRALWLPGCAGLRCSTHTRQGVQSGKHSAEVTSRGSTCCRTGIALAREAGYLHRPRDGELTVDRGPSQRIYIVLIYIRLLCCLRVLETRACIKVGTTVDSRYCRTGTARVSTCACTPAAAASAACATWLATHLVTARAAVKRSTDQDRDKWTGRTTLVKQLYPAKQTSNGLQRAAAVRPSPSTQPWLSATHNTAVCRACGLSRAGAGAGCASDSPVATTVAVDCAGVSTSMQHASV
jgi:hypothetical protein